MQQQKNNLSNDLIQYTLHLADNALVLGQRNSEWTGHGPVLEQDIAVSNIALDLIGQARLLYQYAATLTGGDATEDSLAYLRLEKEYKNCLLVELDKGDWARTVLRQFFFSTYQFYLYRALQNSKDATLSAIAEKAIREVTYHLRWSAEWVIRLGDGTAESHERMMNAVNDLWAYTGELLAASPYETALAQAGIAVDPSSFKDQWQQKVREVIDEATLSLPENNWMQTGGKAGIHTEHLGYVLSELQYMQRTYPGCEW